MPSTAKFSASITATSPASGIDTNRRLSSALATQSIGWRLSWMLVSVLVMPPTEVCGSITEMLGSLLRVSR
ncbi:hypothetical protein D3C78_1357170 [compost metagenome]